MDTIIDSRGRVWTVSPSGTWAIHVDRRGKVLMSPVRDIR